MVVFIFFVLDKDGKVGFFEESFLFADVKSDIVFVMFFIIINNTDVKL